MDRRRGTTNRRRWRKTVVTGGRPSSLEHFRRRQTMNRRAGTTDRRRWRKTVVTGGFPSSPDDEPSSRDDGPLPVFIPELNDILDETHAPVQRRRDNVATVT